MNDASQTPTGPGFDELEIDTTVAHTSRVYDYLLGGKDNFAVDREVAEHAFGPYPGGVDGARADAQSNRKFLGRVVRHLAGQAGIRQFLDLGTGIPNAGNVHTVAQDVAPDARVVYSDNDPIVLAHAHALLGGTAEGKTAYLAGDVRDPEGLVAKAADTLDFDAPVAVMLLGVLHVVPDADDPHGIVARLMAAVPAGSYLALSHMTRDGETEAMGQVHDRLEQRMRTSNPPALRTHDEVLRFFDGLDLVEPGVVKAPLWRPDDEAAHDGPGRVYAGLARKP